MTPRPISTTPRPARRVPLIAAVLLAVLACLGLAACGQDASPSSGASSGPTATTSDQPTKIVSLSPTSTETLFAIGAGKQVVAVDNQSNYPPNAPKTDLSGYKPNVEAILAHGPDLVIAPSDTGDLVGGLKKAGVPTLVLPSATTLADAYGQIDRLGKATGHAPEATKLVAKMKQQIKAAVAKARSGKGLTYLHELDPSLFTVSGKTFIGEIYGLFGMRSIADKVKGGDAYPKLSAEYVVTEDPDLIMLADTDCCQMTVKKAGERAGWGKLTAVTHDQVFVIDKDISSRWGPRIVDFVQAISTVLAEVDPADAAA